MTLQQRRIKTTETLELIRDPMKEISIEELNRNVDQWVRLAARREPIIITEGGKPVATLTGLEPPRHSRRLPDREDKIKQRSQINVDSADYVFEMRD